MDDKELESITQYTHFRKYVYLQKADNGKYFIRFKNHWWEREFRYLVMDDIPNDNHPKYFDTEREAVSWIYNKKRELEKRNFFYNWLKKNKI